MNRLYKLGLRSKLIPHLLVGLLVFLCVLPLILGQFGVHFDVINDYFAPVADSSATDLEATESGIFIWTLIHWTAFCVAFCTSILLLVCYFVKREPMLLIMAIVLVLVGVMDVFHTLVLDQLLPGLCKAPRELIAFPWLLARMSYAFLPLLGASIVLFMEGTPKQLRNFQWGYTLFVVAWFLVLLYIVLDFCSYPDRFPDIVFPNQFIPKPLAFLPLSFFVISIFVFRSYQKQYPSRFAYGLLISLIPSIATQFYLMFGTAILDNYSMIAYMMKILAYGTLFVALCFDFVATHKAHKEFVSIMSHEMRNPLHVSLGISDCLQKGLDGPINDKQRESIDRLTKANQQILSLVNDILDMSKIEAGKTQLVFEDVDLTQILRAVAQSQEGLAKQKGIDLNLNLEDRALMVHGDAKKLSQIFVNLISNSIKYTEKGNISISVKEDNTKYFVLIQDTGVGMTEKEVSDLFLPYHQMQQSETASTGIGLMIAKNFAQLHSGNITVESKKGFGSIFSVELRKKKEQAGS